MFVLQSTLPFNSIFYHWRLPRRLYEQRRVVVFVIRYAIRSAKSGHPAVGQSLDRLVQR